MSGKGKRKKGKSASSQRQQQEDAARRRRPAALPEPGRRVPTPATSPASGSGGTAHDSTGDGGTRHDGTAPGTPPNGSRTAGQRSAPRVRRYLDVSAVRIQDWLGRTPDLKFRRGGSVMLSEVTGREAWPDARLPRGMRWNDEAGDLDGVVSLVIADDVPEPEAAGCLAHAAREVVRQLRDALPHCPVQAVAGLGESYADAYRELELARMGCGFLVDSPAPPGELVLAKPCDRCRAAAAEHPHVVVIKDESAVDLCGECNARLEAAGGTKGDDERRSPRPERRMKKALKKAGMSVNGFPDDFEKMASQGRVDADDAATHLGLIYADGNRVGEFLSAASAAAGHGPDKAEIVRAIDDACLAALADAVITVFPGLTRPPVLAHLAGGDDLMISVSAVRAWPFTRVLVAGFGSRVARAADWPDAIRALLPSLSAGLVFHHRSAPFPDVVRLAKGQLDTAKEATDGREPSIAFLDLTADGGQAPRTRKPETLDDLSRKAARLGQVAYIPRAHRETLIALLRLCEHSEQGSAPGRAEAPPESLARRVVDLGYEPLWEMAAGPGADAQKVRTVLLSDAAARSRLRGALDLARWWPADQASTPAVPFQPPGAREVVSA